MLGQPDSSPSLHLHLSRWREGAGWEMPLCWLVSLKICYHRQTAISHFYGKLSFPLSERDHFTFSRVLSVLQHVLPSLTPSWGHCFSVYRENRGNQERAALSSSPHLSPSLCTITPLDVLRQQSPGWDNLSTVRWPTKAHPVLPPWELCLCSHFLSILYHQFSPPSEIIFISIQMCHVSPIKQTFSKFFSIIASIHCNTS